MSQTLERAIAIAAAAHEGRSTRADRLTSCIR